ncbi:MAG: hypothetical protein ACRD20_20210 [Terriglobales bacterium]
MALPPWAHLYQAAVSETEPARLKERIVLVEEAIFRRMMELEGKSNCQYEKIVLQLALDKLVEIKTTTLK